MIRERAEREIGDERRGGGSDLHGEDGVGPLRVGDNRNGEDRAQAQRHGHSKLTSDAFGAPLRVGEQRLRSLVHAPSAIPSRRLGT